MAEAAALTCAKFRWRDRFAGGTFDQEAVMGHWFDVGDIIDMVEESVMLRRPIVVELRDGRIFEDRAREIVKWRGHDHVVFRRHELTPLHAISMIQRARPPEFTYAGRRL